MGSSNPHRHLLHVFPTFAIGGVPNRIARVVNSLRRNYYHTIISLDGNFAAARILKKEVQTAFETLSLRKSRFLNVSNLRTIRAALRRLRPDMMLTYNWGTIEWATTNRIFRICPHVHFESGFGPDESPDRQHWRRIVARRLLLSGCRHIVVPSVTLCEVATRTWRISPEQVLYVPNGVDSARFAGSPDASVLAEFGIPDDVLLVGTVAPLRREKNLARLIRAFAALPQELDAQLIIVGAGPEEPALQAAAAATSASNRIVFVGEMADPSRILGSFALFALSSDTEQMPNAVLEAMAAGLPVVATDVGDTRRMLAAENAPFVVPVNDEPAMTGAIMTLLRDRVLARHVGQANRERARTQFDFDAMVVRYDRLFSGAEAAPADERPWYADTDIVT